MQLLPTLAISLVTLARFGASYPVGSWNTTGNATQVLRANDPNLNTTTANANTTRLVNATLLAAEIANNITFGKLDIDLVNNIASDNVQAIVSGRDEAGDLILLDENFEWYYPKAEGVEGDKTPLPSTVIHRLGPKDSTTTLKLPDYIYSARVYFSDGDLQMFMVKTADGQGLAEPSPFNPDDPNKNLNWGFAELTNSKTWGLYANLSFVDFVGMALGLKLRRHGNDTSEVKGVPTGGKHKVCNDLRDQAKKDGQPWDQLCINNEEGQLMRVLSPAGLVSMNKTAFSDYWYPYTNGTASMYSKDGITINTQAAAGMVKCNWQGSANAMELQCEGDNRPYPPPTAEDIFGCNTGPFAIHEDDNDVHRAVVPRLCAALNRGTFMMDGGDVQPSVKPDQYYKTETLNWYSAVTHANQLDNRGYAFSYDDVAVDEESDTAGVVTGTNPEVLTIFVGGHNSLASALLQEAQY
ncbi:hypothetical protein Q7P35_005269 [Cladosporium inversicolor]